MKNTFLGIIFATGIIICDLLTKFFATIYLTAPVEIIRGLATFELHKNPGLSFSIPFPNTMQIVISIVLLILLVLYSKQEQRSLIEHLALAAIFGGAIGNLIERILFATVTDFISIWKFPVFNIADIGISVGVVVLLTVELFFAKQAKQQAPSQK